VSGVTNMQRGLDTIAKFRAKVRALPLTLRAEVAKAGEVAITALLRDDFAAERTAYGTQRPLSVHSDKLSIVKSGATKRDLKFVAIGSILRVHLGQRYDRYLIGKYKVLPISTIPAKWQEALMRVVDDAVKRFEREAA
jgi:hypothetical protein